MNQKEKDEYIVKELEAIYEEYEHYTNQLLELKPFLERLIKFANKNIKH